MFSGAGTSAQVSGERLSLEAHEHSMLVGVNGVFRRDRVSLGGEVWLRDVLDSSAKEYSGIVNLGIHF